MKIFRNGEEISLVLSEDQCMLIVNSLRDSVGMIDEFEFIVRLGFGRGFAKEVCEKLLESLETIGISD